MRILIKLIVSAIIWAVLLVPFWMWLGFRGIGVWFLGSVQLLACLLGVILTVALWVSKMNSKPQTPVYTRAPDSDPIVGGSPFFGGEDVGLNGQPVAPRARRNIRPRRQ